MRADELRASLESTATNLFNVDEFVIPALSVVTAEVWVESLVVGGAVLDWLLSSEQASPY